MTTEKILSFLDPKNQNLPSASVRYDFKKIPVIFVPVFEDEEKKTRRIFPFIKRGQVSGKKGEKNEVIRNNQDYFFIGMGPLKNITFRNVRRFFGSAYLSSLSAKPKTVGFYCPLEWLEAAAVGVDVAALNPEMFKPKPKKEAPPAVFYVHPDFKAKKSLAEKAMKAGKLVAHGKNMMRILGAVPPNELTTRSYAEVIMALAKKWKAHCERLSQNKLEKYNLLKAVSAGSEYDPELIVFTLHPKTGKTKECSVVVGKGLCFDSGGVQDKQNYMKDMKEDMAGSAAVLGTIFNILNNGMDLKETTYFLLPLAESMMGRGAMKPDDVYTAGDGQTVEIIHTDAEGRLVVADAICYAKNNFKNITRFYTIATLTGSMFYALGEHYTGMIGNDAELTSEVIRLGKETGEYMYAGPWDLDYDDNNSPVADAANMSEVEREAGWIKAGMFIYKFVPKAKKESEQVKFVHFDIAASIDMAEKGKAWRRKGFNSGVGVGLLSKLLTK